MFFNIDKIVGGKGGGNDAQTPNASSQASPKDPSIGDNIRSRMASNAQDSLANSASSNTDVSFAGAKARIQSKWDSLGSDPDHKNNRSHYTDD